MATSIRAVYKDGHLRPLEPLDLTDGEEVIIAIKRQRGHREERRSRLSARELLGLTMEERNRILEAAALHAETHYRNDPALAEFEAYDERDFYDETP